MKLAIAAGVAVLLSASPALADWQYTRWGMSPDEVAAASNGAVKATKDDKSARFLDLPRLAIGEATEGEAKFVVEFFFSKKQLSLIRYSPTAGMDCAKEEEFLLRQFGPVEPRETSREISGKTTVVIKTRKRAWKLPSGDWMTLDTLQVERPDQPDLRIPPICTNIITQH